MSEPVFVESPVQPVALGLLSPDFRQERLRLNPVPQLAGQGIGRRDLHVGGKLPHLHAAGAYQPE